MDTSLVTAIVECVGVSLSILAGVAVISSRLTNIENKISELGKDNVKIDNRLEKLETRVLEIERAMARREGER
jgi:septation ring formation regulator EzrA